MWSSTPPLLRALMPFSRTIPPRLGPSRSRNCGVMKGRRSLVLDTQWEKEQTSDNGGFSRPFGTYANANATPAVNCRAIVKSPSGREQGDMSKLRRAALPGSRGSSPRQVESNMNGYEPHRFPRLAGRF